MEIVFCERCGVSIPEHQVAGSRQATGGRDLCGSCRGAFGAASEGDLRLYFCENCRVSIPISDVITGTARAEGAGYTCAVCAHLGPEDRAVRRSSVERDLGHATGPVPVLYFCEACNASVPATHVASGRALVRGGRTYCERCRPRVEREGAAPRAGAGVLVFAAALLAAFATAGALLLFEPSSSPEQDKGMQTLRAEVEDLQRSGRRATEVIPILRKDAEDAKQQAARDIDSLRKDVDSLRSSVEGQKKLGEQAAVAQHRSEQELAERIARTEARLEAVSREIRDQVRDLSADLDARAAAAGPRPAGGAPAEGGGEPGTPATAPDSPQDLPGAPQVMGHVSSLRDPDIGARFAAATELGKLAEVPGMLEALRRLAVGPLVDSMKSGKEDVLVRRACARSLGAIKAPESVPALIEVLTDPEEYVAKVAAGVLRDVFGAQEFDKLGYKQGQPKAERKRVADRARKFWDENREKLAPEPVK